MRIEHILKLKEEIPITKEAVGSLLLLRNFCPSSLKSKHTQNYEKYTFEDWKLKQHLFYRGISVQVVCDGVEMVYPCLFFFLIKFYVVTVESK